MVTPPPKPDYVSALEAAYGAPSQAAFGSAVFYTPGSSQGDLEQAALSTYRYFTGELWERFGADAWMSTWQQVYTRPQGAQRAIVTELRALPDHSAAQSAALVLEAVEDPQSAQAALSAAFDDPAVTELAVYKIGDGAEMAGILVAGRRATGETVMLVFLLD